MIRNSLPQQFASVAQNLPIMVEAYDQKGRLIFWNTAAEDTSGYSAAELVKNPKALDILYPGYRKNRTLVGWLKTRGYMLEARTWPMTCKGGEKRVIAWFNVSQEIKITGWHRWAVGWDVTERLQLEREIKQQQKELEKQLQRTAEGRVALRVLLEQLESETKRISRDLSYNINRTVRPFLDKLMQTRLDQRQKELLGVAINHLKNLGEISGLSLDAGQEKLTAMEADVAILINDGKSTSEIAGLLNVAEATINTHRHAIRRKLGLVGKRSSLRAELKNLFMPKTRRLESKL